MHWRRPVPCPASRPTARQATDTPTDAGWLSHSPLTQKRQKQHEPRATPPMCWIKNGSPEKNAHPDQTELKDLSTNQTQHREDLSTNNTPVGQPPIGRPMPPSAPGVPRLGHVQARVVATPPTRSGHTTSPVAVPSPSTNANRTHGVFFVAKLVHHGGTFGGWNLPPVPFALCGPCQSGKIVASKRPESIPIRQPALPPTLLP